MYVSEAAKYISAKDLRDIEEKCCGKSLVLTNTSEQVICHRGLRSIQIKIRNLKRNRRNCNAGAVEHKRSLRGFLRISPTDLNSMRFLNDALDLV